MSALHLHLRRRGGFYSFRAKLPSWTRSLGAPPSFERTLWTSDANEARIRARRATAALTDALEVMRELASMGRVPTPHELLDVLNEVFFGTLFAREQARTRGDAQQPAQELRDAIAGQLARNDLAAEQTALGERFAHRDLSTLPPEPWAHLARLALRTRQHAYVIDGEREQGHYRPDHELAPPVSIRSVAPLLADVATDSMTADVVPGRGLADPPQAPLFSTVWEAFTRDAESKGWAPRSLREARSVRRMVCEVLGDRPLPALGRNDLHEFAAVLRRLPRKHDKPFYAGCANARDKIARADGLRAAIEATIGDAVLFDGQTLPMPRAQAEAQRLSLTTVQKHLAIIRSFGAWLKTRDERRFAATGPFPFEGISVSGRDLARVRHDAGLGKQRRAWQDIEVQQLFASKTWARGDADARASARFWVPLIAFFTGMRREEIAALSLTEIVRDEDTGIWFIALGQARRARLKSPAAIRTMPLHPELLRIGFVHHAVGRRAAGYSRLFAELDNRNVHAAFGNSIGKWFADELNRIGLTDLHLDLHGARHTVISRLINAHAHPVILQRMLGHAPKRQEQEMPPIGEAHRGYGKDILLVAMQRTIARLRYNGLDLAHLSVAAPLPEPLPDMRVRIGHDGAVVPVPRIPLRPPGLPRGMPLEAQ